MVVEDLRFLIESSLAVGGRWGKSPPSDWIQALKWENKLTHRVCYKHEAARKLLFLAHRDILKTWTMPIQNWQLILNQLVIRFEDRIPL